MAVVAGVSLACVASSYWYWSPLFVNVNPLGNILNSLVVDSIPFSQVVYAPSTKYSSLVNLSPLASHVEFGLGQQFSDALYSAWHLGLCGVTVERPQRIWTIYAEV